MLKILGIAVVRQSCGQVPELQFIAEGMDVKIYFQNTPTEINAKGRVSVFKNPGATEVKFGFLGWQICNAPQGHERAKLNPTQEASLKGQANTKILLFTPLLIFDLSTTKYIERGI